MRNARIRSTAIAATALLAGLSLTACGSDDDVNTSGVAAASSIAPTPNVPAADETGRTEQAEQPVSSGKTGTSGRPAKNTSSNTSSGGGSKTGGNKDTGPVTTTCTSKNTKLIVTTMSRPINHMLLTVTNTGSKSCNAYYAPGLAFDGPATQSATQVLEESKPQAVTTLAPGESGYAVIGLSALGEHERQVTDLRVHFASGDGSGSVGPATTLRLPTGTTIDDNAFVTYWVRDVADVAHF